MTTPLLSLGNRAAGEKSLKNRPGVKRLKEISIFLGLAALKHFAHSPREKQKDKSYKASKLAKEVGSLATRIEKDIERIQDLELRVLSRDAHQAQVAKLRQAKILILNAIDGQKIPKESMDIVREAQMLVTQDKQVRAASPMIPFSLSLCLIRLAKHIKAKSLMQ